MPAQGTTRLLEQFVLLDVVGSEPIDQAVVGTDEADLHLAHEHVHVVSRVADEGDAVLVAWHVAVMLQQLRGVVAAIQVRRTNRTAAVERLEVGSGRAHVAQRGEVGMGPQRRTVRRQVVRDVLAEERPTRLAPSVAMGVASVAEPAGGADMVQQRLVDLERR